MPLAGAECDHFYRLDTRWEKQTKPTDTTPESCPPSLPAGFLKVLVLALHNNEEQYLYSLRPGKRTTCRPEDCRPESCPSGWQGAGTGDTRFPSLSLPAVGVYTQSWDGGSTKRFIRPPCSGGALARSPLRRRGFRQRSDARPQHQHRPATSAKTAGGEGPGGRPGTRQGR